ncbi:MOSC domain-containing protein [Pleomorphochaeta sp. DL1XJH-081]|uniref:MOSC domain-containing protein n=1 Tax=Pleomorphochaeta sp. DL1XJH-081 TaxID=3409690 RepID=UPI003BB7F8C8
MAEVVAVCISDKKGVVKHPVEFITVRKDYGIEGDAHAGNWHRQISLLADESVDTMRNKGLTLDAGAFAENILTKGIDLKTLPIGTKLQIGKTILEVTQIGKECHKGCEIQKKTGKCVMPTEGIFAKVIEEGSIRKGDEITILV